MEKRRKVYSEGLNPKFVWPYLLLLLLLLTGSDLLAQSTSNDTINADEANKQKQEIFYDSLQYKAKRHSVTGLLYDFLISHPEPYSGEDSISYNYYAGLEGKLISEIQIIPLEVFGPTFEDTTLQAHSWLEKTANNLHNTTSKKTISNLLLFKVGDFLDPAVMYENERIIRSSRYLQDIRFILEQDSVYSGLVKVYVVTKDRFPFGVSGSANGIQSAALEVYNQNLFGIGHEISFRFVGHLKRQPYAGHETFYRINNIRGKFIDFTGGYMNTFRREGFSLLLDKPFITPSVKWGYGASALRMYRTPHINEHDPVVAELPLDLSFINAWGGYSVTIRPNYVQNSQVVFTAGFSDHQYFERPDLGGDSVRYYANNTFLSGGVTLSQRHYSQDVLVYSYGIMEDIPEGFKNEIVYGYEFNEFGNRHYAHLFLSNGNLLVKRKGYLYLSGGIGGYFRNKSYEQGLLQIGVNYISGRMSAGRKQQRIFVRSNYHLGIRRIPIENLSFNKNDYIRGFRSGSALGKQRLSMNFEYVMFLPKQFYKFSMAAFGFADLGVIGSNKESVFKQDYYSGIGFGMRFHNEHLVFKTFQIRLAFYPFSPSDVSFAGILIDEQLKQKFYEFQPSAPMPLRFE